MSDVQGIITVDSVCMGSIMTETDQVPNMVGKTPDVTKDRVRQEATRQPESRESHVKAKNPSELLYYGVKNQISQGCTIEWRKQMELIAQLVSLRRELNDRPEVRDEASYPDDPLCQGGSRLQVSRAYSEAPDALIERMKLSAFVMIHFESMQEPDECILSVRRCFGIKKQWHRGETQRQTEGAWARSLQRRQNGAKNYFW